LSLKRSVSAVRENAPLGVADLHYSKKYRLALLVDHTSSQSYQM